MKLMQTAIATASRDNRSKRFLSYFFFEITFSRCSVGSNDIEMDLPNFSGVAVKLLC
jgi:hypothetical protein